MTILSKNFVEMGHEVCVVVKDQSKSFFPSHPEVRVIKARDTQNSSNFVHAVHNNIKNVLNIRELLVSEAPDIVLCVGITSLSDVVFAAAFNKGIKKVYFETSNPYKSLQGRIWKIFKKPLSRLADGCIFQTDRAAMYYPGPVRKRSVVIPNPIEAGKFNFSEEVTVRRKEIVSAGRLIPLKGYDVLINAFSKVLEDFPDYRLIIYGEGTERENLSALAISLSISNMVKLPGFSNDVINDIHGASVFVLSSYHEGMPNTLMEAMACGIPCISTDCEMGPRELINDRENGLLVPVGEANHMAKAIISIISSNEFADRLAKNAKKIIAKYDEQVISRIVLDFLLFLTGK